MQTRDRERYEVASFSGGPFWDLEAAFRRVEGVVSTATGYSGGTVEEPCYVDVSTGESGHAETVLIGFDPASVSYHDLLKVFISAHDPTGREYDEAGPGGPYRSVIWYHSPVQKTEACALLTELRASRRYDNPVLTAVMPAERFWPAEEHHQQYYEKLARYFDFRPR
ncbi:MAG TPA: peptide-methionine (S)-S-oxide reductase [Methanoculleus sp.]|nr:peptide-methionine (S)-S-oxide reductase [Methanoculleus sp.]